MKLNNIKEMMIENDELRDLADKLQWTVIVVIETEHGDPLFSRTTNAILVRELPYREDDIVQVNFPNGSIIRKRLDKSQDKTPNLNWTIYCPSMKQIMNVKKLAKAIQIALEEHNPNE